MGLRCLKKNELTYNHLHVFTFLNYHTACVVVMNERTRKYLFSATLNMNSFNRKTQWSAIKLYLSIVQVLLDMFQHFDS